MIKETLATWINRVPYPVFESLVGSYVPIMTLHRVQSDTTPNGHDLEFLRACLRHLRKENYAPISLEELLKKHKENAPISHKSIVFTIDDGFRDNVVETADVFSEFDIPLTCFVITDFIKNGLWPWDDQIKYALANSTVAEATFTLPNNASFTIKPMNGSLLHQKAQLLNQLKAQSQNSIYDWIKRTLFQSLEVDFPDVPPEQYTPASWSDFESFARRGHFVAPHTRTHRILSQLEDNEAQLEIAGSYQDLIDKKLNVSPILAYPTGRHCDFGERDKQLCDDTGLTAAVSTVPGHWYPHSSPYDICRFSMPNNMSEFLQYIGAIEALKDRLRS